MSEPAPNRPGADATGRRWLDRILRGASALGLLLFLGVAVISGGTGLFAVAKSTVDGACGDDCDLRCAGLPPRQKAWWCAEGCGVCRCFSCDVPADCKPKPGEVYDCVASSARETKTCVVRRDPHQ